MRCGLGRLLSLKNVDVHASLYVFRPLVLDDSVWWYLVQIDTPDITFVLEAGDEGYIARICAL